MANRKKIMLLLLAAITLFGFSITANADKPPKEEELITLYAGPLLSQQMQVSFTNHSDLTLTVTSDFFIGGPNKTFPCQTFRLHTEPGVCRLTALLITR